MYIVVIAWAYVAFMMAVAEATNTNGSVLGALITLLLYGVLPCGLLIYIMGTPARKRAIRARQAVESTAAAVAPPNGTSAAPYTGGHSTADAVSPVREKP